MRLESIPCPTKHQFICLSSRGCLSNLTWKIPDPRHGAVPGDSFRGFTYQAFLKLHTEYSSLILEQHPIQDTQNSQPHQFPQNKWGSNPKEEIPPWNPFLTWIQLMMNLCPRKIFCRTPLLELKALAQASPLPVNTDTQPHSTARCEQPREVSSCKFKNVPKTSSQGSMMYHFDFLLSQTRSFSFCWPQHAYFQLYFSKHWTVFRLKFLHTPAFHSTHASSICFCSSLPQISPCLNVPQ